MRAAPQSPPGPYIVFDRLPAGCFAFEVTTDECEPLVRQGEFVVIDPRDCSPAVGSLVLRRFVSGDRLAIVEVVPSLRGTNVYLASHRRPRSAEERHAWIEAGERGGWACGPFATEGSLAGHIGNIIVGRVAGLFLAEPNPAAMLRCANMAVERP